MAASDDSAREGVRLNRSRLRLVYDSSGDVAERPSKAQKIEGSAEAGATRSPSDLLKFLKSRCDALPRRDLS